MQHTTLINADIVMLNEDIVEKDNILALMANRLIDKGYTKQSYLQAVLNREKEYPTGLPTNGVGVAIPHADTKYVLKPGIAVATLKSPVKFNVMGNPEEEVDVKLLFMLALKEPKVQVNVLKKLVSIFQVKELLVKLISINNEKELADTLNSLLMNDED
ncbi:MAG: PTS sugar transporter subunit IIA [Tepidanaerobacteraceae bacterium]|nr:PTS sugar transporter subunit IIA [Thermoanaerobacterales bacterium]